MHGVRDQRFQLFYRICLHVLRDSLNVRGSAIELLPLKITSWLCDHTVSYPFIQRVLKNVARITVR